MFANSRLQYSCLLLSAVFAASACSLVHCDSNSSNSAHAAAYDAQLIHEQHHSRHLRQSEPAMIATAASGAGVALPPQDHHAAPGDILALGSTGSTSTSFSFMLLDGKTLKVKARLERYLTSVCSSGPISTATLTFSPRNPQRLILACQRPNSTLSSSSSSRTQLSNQGSATQDASSAHYQLVALDLPSLQAVVLQELPMGFEPFAAVSDAEGNLYLQATKADGSTTLEPAAAVGAITGRTYLNTVMKFDAHLKVTAQYVLPVTSSSMIGMDLAVGGSTLLYTDFSPQESTFQFSTATSQASLAASLGNSSSCTAVAGLYDNTTLLGCQAVSDSNSNFCVILIKRNTTSRQHNVPASSAQVLRSWCTPAQVTRSTPGGPKPNLLFSGQAKGWVGLAVADDRQHVYVSVIREDTNVESTGHQPAAATSTRNLYKLRISDLAQVYSSSVPANVVTMAVVGAVPATQQVCRVGFGQCCSQAGIPLPRDAVCDTSSDPCTFAARCNGHDITCPSRQKAADGTACSFKPYGVFPQTSIHRSGYAATRDPHAAVSAAAHSGHHPRTGRRCYKGQCARVIVIEDRKEDQQHSGSHRNHRPASSKEDSHGRLF